MDPPSDFISHPTEKKSLGVLLKDFFKYYAYEFPLATHYVSVSGMDIFPKENKEWKVQATPMLSVECIINPGKHSSPYCFHVRYTASEGPNIEQNRLLTMCADKDITRGASKIRAVLDAFRYASDTLSSSPLVPGESLLGKVIQVPKNVSIEFQYCVEQVDLQTCRWRNLENYSRLSWITVHLTELYPYLQGHESSCLIRTVGHRLLCWNA